MGQATAVITVDVRSRGPVGLGLSVALTAVLIAAAATVGLVVLRPKLAELRTLDAAQATASAATAAAEADAAARTQELRYMRLRWQAGAAEAEALGFVDARICEVASGDLDTTLAALDALAHAEDPVVAELPAWQAASRSPAAADAYRNCESGGTP